MSRRHGLDNQSLGGKLAPRIAQIVSQVMTDHLRKSSLHRAHIGKEAALLFFETLEAERNIHAQDLLELWRGHDENHPAMQKILDFIHHGKGELSSLLAHSALGGAISTSIGSGLANILAPANQAIMYADPSQILDPSTMASLAAGRIVSGDYAKRIARMSGIPEEATEYLIEAARQWPGGGELMELLRRKQIKGEDAVQAMRRQGIPEEFIGPLLDLRNVHLSPEDYALIVLKGIMGENEAAEGAAKSGINSESFKLMIQMTGEPPGLQELQEAYRRGLIDEKRFEHGVRQSRLRNEWTDMLLALRFVPASPADAIRGAVQNHISKDEAKHIATLGGLRPEDFDWMLETAGNPPGPMQMIDLWRRGKMTEDQVKQGIREGRTKNKYIDSLVHLKRVLPEGRQVITMVTRGAITEQEGARLLHERGYDTATVKGMIHAATSDQASREKSLARAEVQELYYDHTITEEEALALLHKLGYTEHTARLVLSMLDLKRERSLQQAAMGPIRSAYIARHISENEASTQLDQIGINHKQRDFALHMWKVDREAHRKSLSEAQIVKANEHGLLDDAAAISRLEALGYVLQDAKLLLDLEKSRDHPLS